VLDEFSLDNPKTKEALNFFSNLKVTPLKKSSRILLLLDKIDDNLSRALGNIEFLSFSLAKDTHVYEILLHKKVLITKNAFAELLERIKL
jgi:large subunit ribosomal protein L4